MSFRLYFALSLLTISAFVTHKSPVAAQERTFNLPQPVPSTPTSQPAKLINVSALVEKLRTANERERYDIIRQLSDISSNQVPTLVQALNDPDPLVKSGVAEALGDLTDDAVTAIPALVEMIKDERRAIAPESFQSVYFPSPVPPPLPVLPGLGSPPPKRVPPLTPDNPEKLLKITAIAALGKIGLPARTLATAPLTQALEDPDPWVKLNATWALAEIGASTSLLPYWLAALQHPNPDVRSQAAAVFQDSSSLLRKVFGAEATDSTVAPLLKALQDEDSTVRSAAKDGLTLLGTRALPSLVQALEAPEPIVRLEATNLLGNLGGAAQSAIPGLVALLDDPERYVPPPSNQLGWLLPSVPRFYSGFSPYPPAPNNPDQLVRVSAAIALGKLGDRSTIPALTTALKDNNPWMQLATSWALLKLGQTQGLPIVGKLIQSPEGAIQQEALLQIEGYGSQAAPYLVPYYAPRLDSANDDIRNGAIIRLGKLGPPSLNLVPKLRSLLVSNQKHSPGYAATILGEIARDTAAAWQNGNLSTAQRQQAIAELTKVLNIMQAPDARFNRQPVERVRNALTTLQGQGGRL